MHQSMTGFGRGEFKTDTLQCVVEVRSLNTRFVEVRVQGLKEMLALEADVIQKIKKKFSRGKFDVHVKLTSLTHDWVAREKHFVDHYKYLKGLARKMGFKDEVVSFEAVLSYTPSKSTKFKMPKIKKSIENCLVDAMKQLEQARMREGQALIFDIQKRVKIMQKDLSMIQRRMNTLPKRKFKMLKEQVLKTLSNPEMLNRERLELEVSVLVERSDITEELVRLGSHFKSVVELMDSNDNQKGIGRRLDFFIQEIHRELNTIGSKASDAFVTNKVVALKSQLEKIREQVQNLA